MLNNNINPFELKKQLGLTILEELNDKETANKAASYFESTTVDKNIPESIPEINIISDVDVHLPKFFVENKITKSNSEARRLIESDSVRINDKPINNLDIKSNDLINNVLQVGKRRFFKIISK